MKYPTKILIGVAIVAIFTGLIILFDAYFLQDSIRGWDIEITLPEGGITEMDFYVNRNNLQPITDGRISEVFKRFISDDDVEYTFSQETGGLIGISRRGNISDRPELPTISIEEMEKISDTAFSVFADPVKYIRTHQYKEDARIHWFDYVMVINGYETTESGSVWVCNSGYVRLITSPIVGKFDNVRIPPIDESVLDEKFEEAVREQFGDIRFSIHERILTLRDGRPVMLYSYIRTYCEEFDVADIIEIELR
jgi:hypothetical protein